MNVVTLRLTMDHVNIPGMTDKKPRKNVHRFRGVASEDRRVQRRRMLIDAGIEIFGTRGFHATTVKEICAQAKLTERYFYESFANREALYAAVYEQMTGRLRDAMVTALIKPERAVGILARSALTTLFGAMRDDPRLVRILFVDVFTVSHDVNQLSMRTTRSFAELIKAMIEGLYPDPKRSPSDTFLIANGLLGALLNTIMHWAYNGYQESLDDVVRNNTTLFEALGAHFETNAAGNAKARSTDKARAP